MATQISRQPHIAFRARIGRNDARFDADNWWNRSVSTSPVRRCADTQALIWPRKAAEQGDVDAEDNLGAMYSNGHGVPQDYAQAIVWFRKAAQQGNADAQYNLGVMCQDGPGVPQDYVLAHMRLNFAASRAAD